MKIENFISYEQPTNYIVHSDQYTKDGQIPVLTAGQSFVLGYTDEEDGIYTGEPVVIFDDFTTSVQYVDFPFKVKSSAMKILKNKQNANIKFCYYLLSWLQKMPPNHKRQWISTTSQIDVNLPPIEWQKKIVQKIEAVSNIIKYRKEELKKLDELVSARFVEMFGDAVANPMHWPIKKLKELSVQINSGNTPKGGSENYVEDGITFFRSQNVWKDRLEMDDIAYIDAATHASMKRSSLKHGDILMTKTGRINTENSSLGRAALYDGEDDMANVNGHVYFIRLKDGVNNKFILRILVSPEYRELIRSVCVGGIDKRQLNKEHIEDFPIICPPSDMVDNYIVFADQVDKSKVVVSTNIVYNIKRIKTEFLNYYFNEL